MNFQLSQFPVTAVALAWFMWVALAFVGGYLLKQENLPRDNWLAAGMVAVFVWCLHGQLNAGELAGLHYHLLGVTLILLIVGLPAALFLLTATAAVYAVLFQQYQDIAAVALYVITVIFPALLLGKIMLVVAQKILPRHLFIFIFLMVFWRLCCVCCWQVRCLCGCWIWLGRILRNCCGAARFLCCFCCLGAKRF